MVFYQSLYCRGQGGAETRQNLRENPFKQNRAPLRFIDTAVRGVSSISSDNDLRSNFSIATQNVETLRTACKAFGFSAPSNFRKEQLVDRLTSLRNGIDPDQRIWAKDWKLSGVRSADHRDKSSGNTPKIRGGLTNMVLAEVDPLDNDQAAAYLWSLIIDDVVVRCLWTSCNTKANRDGENLADEEPIDPNEEIQLNQHLQQAHREAIGQEEEQIMPDAPVVEGRGRRVWSHWLHGLLQDFDSFKKAFISYAIVQICDSVNPTTRMEDQWNILRDLRDLHPQSPIIRHIMPRDHFREFRALLTIGDVGEPQNELIKAINKNLKTVYVPFLHTVLDEMPIPHAGPGPVVYDPSKPYTDYIKVIGLADENHVVSIIFPCFDTTKKLETKELFIACHELLAFHKLSASAIIADSWFTTIASAEWLQEHDRKFCLSLKNLTQNPLIARMTDDLRPGDVRYVEHLRQHGWPQPGTRDTVTNPILWTAFKQASLKKERKPIMTLSNFLKIGQVNLENGSVKPVTIDFYAKKLGGIDKVDQCMLELSGKRGHRSWKIKAVHWFIHLAMHNAWGYYKTLGRHELTHYQFCNHLIWGLVGDRIVEIKQKLIAAVAVPVVVCFPIKTDRHRRCKSCGRDSSTEYICKCSGVPLHPACFEVYHRNFAFQVERNWNPNILQQAGTIIRNAAQNLRHWVHL